MKNSCTRSVVSRFLEKFQRTKHLVKAQCPYLMKMNFKCTSDVERSICLHVIDEELLNRIRPDFATKRYSHKLSGLRSGAP
ncbi:hypothetical protein QE152_g6640 [Popillia japonica]|uniref:Uncharacterized protein n=1 Tax=Popillia japonica TaxID=7064 RepID=A0AAW1MHL8_POPJA